MRAKFEVGEAVEMLCYHLREGRVVGCVPAVQATQEGLMRLMAGVERERET